VDHFLCYQVKTTPGTPKFVPIPGVHLVDQFETGDFDIKKPVSLCTPADKNSEGILDPLTHVKGYEIDAVKGSPKHVKQTNIRVDNQFGTLLVDTIKPDRLLVPTAKSLTGPVGPPDPATHNVDHYKCYDVKVSSGTPKFVPRSVSVVDQFNQPKVFDVTKPTQLCTPVDKRSEGIKNPFGHLMCYQVKPDKGQPKHTPVVNIIHVNNQFGPEQLDTVKETELCVPSSKTP
jgi:hypothetical protein